MGTAFETWFLVVGGVFLFMGIATSKLKHLPLSTSLIYLGIGACVGPWGLGLIAIEPEKSPLFLEHVTEIAVIVSLFAAGLKLRVSLRDRRWRAPISLAFVSMGLTVGCVALLGSLLLDLSLGAAILLGALLAPTDPVLASDVQVSEAGDRDRVRFALTGEAGLNDGTAFPFVMLGLGLMGLHKIGEHGMRWLAVDVLWAIAAGLATGVLCGLVVSRLVLYLRKRHKEAVGLDDFLGLGLMALAYGVAIAIHAYGFLAVFAAGLTLRREEFNASPESPTPPELEGDSVGLATHPDKAPAYMVSAIQGFYEQLERIGEAVVVILVGTMLAYVEVTMTNVLLALALFFVVRPVSVAILNVDAAPLQRRLVAWFGIRGIGSLYYLFYALGRGVPDSVAKTLVNATLTVVVLSALFHGVTVTPFMNRYSRWKEMRRNNRRLQQHA